MKEILIILLLTKLASIGYSCSCTGSSDYSNNEITIEWYNNHEYVFQARIDSVYTEELSQNNFHPFQNVYLSIQRIYKGNLPIKVMITPPYFGTSCSFDLRGEVGKFYIVYGYKDAEGKLNTHFCHGTKRFYSQKDLDSLKHLNNKKSGTKLKNDFIKSLVHEVAFLNKIASISNGKVFAKYSNSKLSGQGNFVNGLPESKWVYYSFKGEKVAEGNYTNGYKNGEWKVYDFGRFSESTNRQYSVGNFINGLKEGEWKNYRFNGEYINSHNYKNGIISH
jgi:antitoxin component YwqK of YwqJK toxin-antitoxin module